MYFTDRGLEELADRRGEEQVTLARELRHPGVELLERGGIQRDLRRGRRVGHDDAP